jgi:pilus assembly protein CpaE
VTEKTVLVIDSDSASRMFLTRMLEQQQYGVLQASSGKEGLINVWRDRPDLVLVDPVLPDISCDEFITKLRQDRRTAELPAIALSRDPSPDLQARCKAGGFNEYLVKSAEVIQTLADVIARQFQTQTNRTEGGFLVVFLSAKGGTGTSSLCANVATSMYKNQPEADIVVADLVLPIGSIAPIVGYQGDLDLSKITAMASEQTTGDFFRENLPSPEPWGFQLLAGAPDPEIANQLDVRRIPDIISTLQRTYDFVLVDLGRSLSRISLPLIQQADLLVLVVSTDQSTVTLTKTVWEYLQAQGVDPRRVYAILNRAVGLEGLTKAEAEEVIGLEIKFTMPYMASNFTLANNQSLPIIEKFPHDTASVVLKESSSGMVKQAQLLRAS